MKIIKRYLIWSFCLLCICVTFQSCNNCSDTLDYMPSPSVRFEYVDRAGQNLIKTNNSRYHPDSIQLSSNGENIFALHELDPETKGYRFSFYPKFESDGKSEILIRLNRSDTDTLTVFYVQHSEKCYDYYSYTHFLVNMLSISPQPATGLLSIVK